MPSAEIITIGTEILLGELVDTNAAYIARSLRENGIDLFRKTSVGDNAQRIARIIQQALERCEVVITTGGLGPTIDDPTREAVALAFGVGTEFHPELWEQIQKRFLRFHRQPTENNQRQAYIPQGAIAIENLVGTAPAFMVESNGQVVISLPGVPREMEYLMENSVLPYLRQRFPQAGLIVTRILHTSGAGESQIDQLIGDLETLANPTVGLAAHSGQVDVRIAAKAGSPAEAEALIQPVEQDLRQRLGNWIFGADEDTLPRVALRRLKERGWKLAVVEAGVRGDLVGQLFDAGEGFISGEMYPAPMDIGTLRRRTAAYCQASGADVALGVSLHPELENQAVTILLMAPSGDQEIQRPYGGPPKLAPRWASNQSMNLLRNL